MEPFDREHDELSWSARVLPLYYLDPTPLALLTRQLRASVWKHVAVTCCSAPSLLRDCWCSGRSAWPRRGDWRSPFRRKTPWMASTPPSSFPTVEPPLAEQPAWHPSSDAPFHRGVQVVGLRGQRHESPQSASKVWRAKRDFILSLGFALQRANVRMLRGSSLRRRRNRAKDCFASGSRSQ
eukprot:COSAG06_NODE_3424_length_5365_cov_15.833080_7_plen_181_part_00